MTMARIARTNKVALKELFMAHETCIKVGCNGIIKWRSLIFLLSFFGITMHLYEVCALYKQ